MRDREGKRRPARFVAAELLEDRTLPAITFLFDYSLDTNGFFNNASAKLALEQVANEIGSRLQDSLAAVGTGTWTVSHPGFEFGQPGRDISLSFSVPQNAIRVFAGSRLMPGFQAGEGGWRTNTGARDFDEATDFQPFAGYVSFDTFSDGSGRWDYVGSGNGTDFKAVARHELLHILGIGSQVVDTWARYAGGGTFTGPNATAANGGVNPALAAGGFHFAQTENSIMRPVVSEIEYVTPVDYGALQDVGWIVTPPPAPGTYADVLGRTSGGTWYVSRNLGTGFSAPDGFGQWSEAAVWRDVARGDFNNDGLTDVIGRTAGGQWWVGINTRANLSMRLFGSWVEGQNWRDVRVGDFNNDGFDDVAGRSASGQWWVARSNGTSFTTTAFGAWVESLGWRDVSVGDFDADGDSDIVGRTSTGRWWIARSTGTSFVTSPFGGWTESVGWRDVRTGDFNLDGRTDVIGRTNTGAWWAALSNGTAFVTQFFNSWVEGANWRGILVGEFTGDGRPDILARTAGGAWWVGETTNAGFAFRSYSSWDENAGWQDLTAANFSGDGRADIVARMADGRWWIGENSGARIVFRQFGAWSPSLVWRDVGVARNYVLTGPADSRTADATRISTLPVVAGDEPLNALVRSTVSGEPSVAVTVEDEEPELRIAEREEPSAPVAATRFDLAFADGLLLDSLLAVA